MHYVPHDKVLPQCAAEISSLNTHMELMRAKVDDTHKLLTEEVVPALAVLSEKKKSKQSILNTIAKSTLTKIIVGVLTAIGLALISVLGFGCEGNMHRIEDADAVLEDGGLRRFADQNLPGTIGTVDRAEWNNAVQEELASIIEINGGTLNTTAAADRSAEWRQVHDTIFLEGNITTAAIDNISVSVLSDGEIDITSGNYRWQQDEDRLRYYESIAVDDYYETRLTGRQLYFGQASPETGVPLDQLTLTVAEGLTIDEQDDATGSIEIAKTQYQARGIHYDQRFGTSTNLSTAVYRKEGYSVTGITWSTSGSIQSASLASNLSTGIPFGTGVTLTAAWLQFSVVGAEKIAPVTVRTVENTDVLEVVSFQLLSSDTPSGTTAELILEYNAAELSD